MMSYVGTTNFLMHMRIDEFANTTNNITNIPGGQSIVHTMLLPDNGVTMHMDSALQYPEMEKRVLSQEYHPSYNTLTISFVFTTGALGTMPAHSIFLTIKCK